MVTNPARNQRHHDDLSSTGSLSRPAVHKTASIQVHQRYQVQDRLPLGGDTVSAALHGTPYFSWNWGKTWKEWSICISQDSFDGGDEDKDRPDPRWTIITEGIARSQAELRLYTPLHVFQKRCFEKGVGWTHGEAVGREEGGVGWACSNGSIFIWTDTLLYTSINCIAFPCASALV
jgi:hypothetical protein